MYRFAISIIYIFIFIGISIRPTFASSNPIIDIIYIWMGVYFVSFVLLLLIIYSILSKLRLSNKVKTAIIFIIVTVLIFSFMRPIPPEKIHSEPPAWKQENLAR